MNYKNDLYVSLIKFGLKAKVRGNVELFKVVEPSKLLSNELKTSTLKSVCRLTDDIYESDTSFHWFAMSDYFSSVKVVWLVFSNKCLIGFSAINIINGCGEKIIYVDNLNVQRTDEKVFANYSVGSMLVNEIVQENTRYFVFPISYIFRTQNPNIYRLSYKILPRGIYPRITGEKGRNETRSMCINSFMAEKLSPNKVYKEKTSVIKNAYKGQIYSVDSKVVNTQREEIKAFWNKNIDMENGDALLISISPHRWEFIAVNLFYRTNLAVDKLKSISMRSKN